jgi:hypothetical protein
MKLVKGNVTIGVQTRFGPNWPGKRCLAKTRRGTACQRAAYKHNGRCALHGGRSTGPRTQRGLQRISEANLKHGRQTKDKLAAQRHAAKVGRRVLGELKQLERQLAAAGLMPDGN